MPVSKKPRKKYSGGKTANLPTTGSIFGGLGRLLGDGLTFLMDSTAGRPRHVGEGTKRAEARLAAKRKANAKIPSEGKMTRQRVRAAERAEAKAARSAQKQQRALKRA